ncbi:hypothetical protein J4219_03740 [Candidatus Woesearchaeota archaeon]|nr:hypothetical protein [Candidatus Woesearchaeota archaeon]
MKHIKLAIKERKTVLDEFAKILAKVRKGESSFNESELSFQNIDTLRKVLTEKRMELLHAIKRQSPGSIYELAKIVDRDLKSVNTDITVLVNLGLVSLEKSKDERKKSKPSVDFDRLSVEIAI